MITLAFTCTGPYAILIMLGIKRVENRSMLPTSSKGRCAISCSKSFTKEGYGEFVQWAARALSATEFETIPAWNEVKSWPGKIVGTCDYSSRSRNDLVLNAAAEDAARTFRAALPIVRESEGFFVLPPDENRRVLAEPVLVSLGISSVTTSVQPSEVFGAALAVGAKSIIVAHNHPGGNLTPSVQDRQLTTVLASLGEQLGVKLLDHIVLGKNGEYDRISLATK